jgi:hypothetical protein
MSWVITGRQVDAADPDARAYLAAVEAADTQALEPAVRLAVDAFVVGCKADGIWNAIKASCILAGARTRLGALTPLVGAAPTSFNFVDGDYNRKTGLGGDGSTKYLDSNRNNNADPQNSNHNAAYVTTVGTAVRTLLGAADSSSAGSGANQLASDGLTRSRSSTSQSAIAVVSPGLFGHSRAASGSYTIRISGNNEIKSQSSATPLSANVLVFRRQGNAPAYSNARLAFYSIGESLDLALLDTRVTTLVNAFAAAIP